MRLVGIGNLFIPRKYVREGFDLLSERGIAVLNTPGRNADSVVIRHVLRWARKRLVG